jgi:hypothetical protein
MMHQKSGSPREVMRQKNNLNLQLPVLKPPVEIPVLEILLFIYLFIIVCNV